MLPAARLSEALPVSFLWARDRAHASAAPADVDAMTNRVDHPSA
jgi:hypothetical protein